MYFTDEKSQGFCESIIWQPEYVNSITSFAMLFFSVLGLFFNKSTNKFVTIVFSSILVNFLGSFAFHYSLYEGWGLVDTISMLLASYYGMYVLWTLILEFCVIRSILYYISTVFFIITNFALTFSLTDRALQHFIGFNTAIALPFVAIITGTVVEIIIAHVKGVPWQIIKYLIIGVISVFTSSFIWLLTEPFCYTKDRRIAYTFSHAFWHLFVSYGFYLIGVCNIYIHGWHRRNRSVLEYTFHTNGLFTVFPRCTYVVNKPTSPRSVTELTRTEV